MDENEKNLSPKEEYDQKKQKKEEKKYGQEIKTKVAKKSRSTLIVITVIVIVVVIGFLFVKVNSSIPNLPSTSMQNHIEESPETHVVTTPILGQIQRHMLEHADGGDIPGVIIQYNCESDLVEKLTKLTEEYPENVYLAPNNYDGKIVLTRLGEIEVLNEFDEQKIRDFIE
jgi:hypothetical protein